MTDRSEKQQPEVEWIILADSAKLVGGKLYVLGGGWSVLTVHDAFPHQQLLGIAASFLVPSSWRDRQITFTAKIIAEATGKSVMEIAGELETGVGSFGLDDFERAAMAAEALVELHVGAYIVTARLEGSEEKRLRFHVRGIPGATPQRRGRNHTR